MIRQHNPYGCGMYAVANALNIPDFVTDERLNLSEKNGNTLGQLSKWLQEDDLNFAIDALYYNHTGKKLPPSALNYVPKGENATFLPVLINVQFSEEGKRHMVGGLIHQDGNLFLMDSLSEDPEITTLAKVNRKYYKVFGLFIFMDADTGNYVFYG